MKLWIDGVTAKAVGPQELKKNLKLDPEGWHKWTGGRQVPGGAEQKVGIDLRDHPKATTTWLVKVLEPHKDRGSKQLRRDALVYLDAISNGMGQAKPRSLSTFADLLTTYLSKFPGPRVYTPGPSGRMLAWHVNGVGYVPPRKERDFTTRAYVWVKLLAEDFGGVINETINFLDTEVMGKTVAEAITEKKFYPETDSLRAEYLDVIAHFNDVRNNLGRQYFAEGVASDDCDGNNTRQDSWYWRRTNTVAMTREGAPSRVVADVFYEDEATQQRQSHRESVRPDPYFWKKNKAIRGEEGNDEYEGDEDDDNAEFEDFVEVPIQPYVAVFDLARHLRVKIDARQLTPYPYDATILDKLVMSAERKRLVDLLVNMRAGDHNDVVKGKSGGAVVLLAGPPGVGKTLTAEVFAERDGRALYSVQCSQLGVDPETLEESLLKIFARTRRWNAVLLLDEADVYVHERGNDMNQNAVVGVFLRTLEYQSSVLFLTTNRPDDVDDAIASRCVARLGYEKPDADQQAQLWRVLCDAAKKPITDATIKQLVTRAEGKGRHDSGRDIKNLVKLASLMTEDGSVTVEHVEYVRQFKPTS